MSQDDYDHFGPIDFLVVEFPSGKPTQAGFDLLLAEVDAGRIRILDLEFVTKSAGQVTTVDVDSISAPWASALAGASSGLLDTDDFGILSEELIDGALAAIVVYEELSILAVMDAFESEGARMVIEGHLSPEELDAALDATEA